MRCERPARVKRAAAVVLGFEEAAGRPTRGGAVLLLLLYRSRDNQQRCAQHDDDVRFAYRNYLRRYNLNRETAAPLMRLDLDGDQVFILDD